MFDYTIAMIKRTISLSPFGELLCVKSKSPSHKDALCKGKMKLANWILRRALFKFRQFNFAIPLLSLLGRDP